MRKSRSFRKLKELKQVNELESFMTKPKLFDPYEEAAYFREFLTAKNVAHKYTSSHKVGSDSCYVFVAIPFKEKQRYTFRFSTHLLVKPALENELLFDCKSSEEARAFFEKEVIELLTNLLKKP